VLDQVKKLAAVFLTAVALAALAGCSSAAGSLDGTAWRLTGWTLSSLYPGDFTITASFAGGQISGRSGVNSYGGTYRAGAGGSFEVGELASTLMAGPEPDMRAEAAYLELLGAAGSYKLDGSTLTLYDRNGSESLIFTAGGG